MFGSEKEEIDRDILELVNDPLVARILWNRGYRTLDAARAFLYPDCYTPADPSALPGLNDAVALLADSLASGDRVCVYGDYDVDGVSATALLVRVLRSLGADVVYHAPEQVHRGVRPERRRHQGSRSPRLSPAADLRLRHRQPRRGRAGTGTWG